MDNILAKRDLTAEQMHMVQSEMEKQGKSKVIMFLLWWFTAIFGGHRFYLGDIGYAIGMLLTFGGIGFWALIDVFFINKRLEKKNNELELELIRKAKAK